MHCMNAMSMLLLLDWDNRLFISCVLCNLSYSIFQSFNITKHNAGTSNDANGKNTINSNLLKL